MMPLNQPSDSDRQSSPQGPLSAGHSDKASEGASIETNELDAKTLPPDPDLSRSQGPESVREIFDLLERLFSNARDSEKVHVRDQAERIRESLSPLWEQLQKAFETIRDRNTDFDQKKDASAKLFEIAEAYCLEHADFISGRISQTFQAKTPDQTQEKATPSDELSSKVKNGIPIFFAILHRLWGSLERDIYTVAANDHNFSNRATALASLTTDIYYIQRQIRGLMGLKHLIASEFSSAQEAISALPELEEGKHAERQRAIMEIVSKAIERATPGLVPHLEELGVFWHKAIQTLSTIFSGLHPESFSRFEHFQNKMTTVMAFPEVRTIIEADLKKPLSTLYETFEPEPFAAASIAQLHRATTRRRDGSVEAVVVKVKKSWVADELESNIKVNHAFISWIKLDTKTSEWHGALEILATQLEALAETFVAELDFAAEARRQVRFHRLFSFDSHIYVPRIDRKRCGDNTITMEDIGQAERLSFDLPPQFRTTRSDDKHDADSQSHPENESRPGQSEMNSPLDSLGDEAAEQEQDQADDISSSHTSPAEGLTEQLFSVYCDLQNLTGFKLGPQYLQLARGLGPLVGLGLRALHQLPGPKEDLTEEHIEAVRTIAKRAKLAVRLVADQLLYIGELHSDLQPANILMGIKERLLLLDFGQTLRTRGLITAPVGLFVGLITGNPEKTLRALRTLGTVDTTLPDKDTLAAIAETFATHGIERRSLFKVILGALRSGETTVAADAALSIKLDEENPALEDEPSRDSSQGQDSAPSENDPTSNSPKPQALNAKDLRAIIRWGAKTAATAPFQWLKYKILSAYDYLAG